MDKKIELKAKIYDLMVEVEQHQIAMGKLQQEIKRLNAEIKQLNELPDKDAA